VSPAIAITRCRPRAYGPASRPRRLIPPPKTRPRDTGSAAAARVDTSLASYPGATRDAQLTAAYTCMAAVKTKLTTQAARARGGRRPPPAAFGGANSGNEANVLRYSFHDCPNDVDAPAGTPGGCNGALRTTIATMIKNGVYRAGAAPFPQDLGLDTAQALLVGNNGISGVCGQVRAQTAGCSTMPFADCISFAGLLAVAYRGGTPASGCPWVPGRVDYEGNHAATLLPSEKHDADTTLATFAK